MAKETEKDRSLKPGSSGSESCAEPCSPEQAVMYATMLFACYRAAEASEPKVYMAACERILRCYPERVAQAVCDPLDGLPSQSKFLPSIAEIKEACEKENGTWRPPDGMLSPQGYVYDSSKIGGINFLAEPRNRKFFYEN
jgi:hypothetical protein